MSNQGKELYDAAKKGDAARVSALLKSGADVNWKDVSACWLASWERRVYVCVGGGCGGGGGVGIRA